MWPVSAILVLAVCKAFVPTILRSSVPLVVAPCVVGTAYGLYEIAESIGSMAGHPLVGYMRDKSHGYVGTCLCVRVRVRVYVRKCVRAVVC